MSKLEIESKILVGAESKAWLADVQGVLARMEKVARILRSPEEHEAADDEASSDDAPADEEEGFDSKPARSAKGGKGKKGASFDDVEEEETEEESEEEEEEEAPKAAKGKGAAKITVDDVNDACMARAQRTNRAEVMAILKKQFKVKSVTELEPSDFAAVVAAMKAKK